MKEVILSKDDNITEDSEYYKQVDVSVVRQLLPKECKSQTDIIVSLGAEFFVVEQEAKNKVACKIYAIAPGPVRVFEWNQEKGLWEGVILYRGERKFFLSVVLGKILEC